MTRPNVVSLVPSITECLIDWGLPPIACTRFCERPELPHVGGTKDPDLDAIVELQPDVVAFCEEENLLEHFEALEAAGLRCHSVRIDRVEDVPEQMAGLAATLELDVGVIELPDRPSSTADPARAFVPIWRRPWMSLGPDTYGSSLLAWLGIDNIFADSADRYPECSTEAIVAARPDIVLAPTEPYPFGDRHLAELSDFAPARLVDGQDLFWWGTRTPAAIGRLADALDPLIPGA